MASKHKYYEYYSVACFVVRTEKVALFICALFLLVSSYLLLLSLQGGYFLREDEFHYWRLGPPALFYICACAALLFGYYTDRPSYLMVFLLVNGISIATFVVVFIELLVAYSYPSMRNEIMFGILSGHYDADISVRNRPIDVVPYLLLFQVGIQLLLLLAWMAQGVVYHFYRYLKHRKAERFQRSSTDCLRISHLRRLHSSQNIPTMGNATQMASPPKKYSGANEGGGLATKTIEQKF